MNINPKIGGAAFGAGLGLYVSDTENSPVSSLLIGGIAGGIGYHTDFTIPDFKKATTFKKSVSVDNNYLNSVSSAGNSEANLNAYETLLKKYNVFKMQARSSFLDYIEDADEATPIYSKKTAYEEALLLRKEAHKQLASKYSDLIFKLKKIGLTTITDVASINEEFLKISKDRVKMGQVLAILEGSSVLSSSSLAGLDTLKKSVLKIQGNDAYSKLVNHLTTELNQPKHLAELFASNVAERTGENAIEISGHNISFKDIDGSKVKLPLTAYDTNGVKYNNKGNGVVSSVHGFNPYARQYINNQASSKDILTQYTPESMISFLDKNTPIDKKTKQAINSLHVFSPEQSGASITNLGNGTPTITNGSFIHSSNLTEFKHALSVDGKTFRPLSSNAKAGNKPENKELVYRLTEDHPNMAASLHFGKTLNTETSLNLNGGNTLAAFPTIERGTTTVGARSYETTQSSALESLRKTMGKDATQIDTSIIAKTTQVADVALFNDLFSKMYGINSHVLGDGSGMMSANTNLSVTESSILKIPKSAAGNFLIEDKNLLTWLTSREKDANGVPIVNGKPLEFTPKDIVGYSTDGGKVRLSSSYSKGVVNNVVIGEDGDLLLHMKQTFDSASEQGVKFFSEASKAMFHGIEDNSFKVAQALIEDINKHPEKMQDLRNNPAKLEAYKKFITASKERLSAFDATFITAAENTGMDKLIKLSEEASKLKTVAEINSNTLSTISEKELELFKKASKTIVHTNEEKVVHSIAMAAATLSQTKLSTDLHVNIHNSIFPHLDGVLGNRTESTISAAQQVINNLQELDAGLLGNKKYSVKDMSDKQLLNLSDKLRKAFTQTFNAKNIIKDPLKTRALAIQFSNVLKSKEIQKGNFLTIGSLGRGRAGVGTNNQVKLSHTAAKQLRLNGFHKEELDVFFQTDSKKLIEVKSVIEEKYRQKHTINGKMNGPEFSRAMQLGPEERATVLKNLGVNTEGQLLSYNLEHPIGNLKSVNIPLVSTSHTGLYENGLLTVQKELEKQRTKIIQADMALAENKSSKTLQDNLVRHVSDYNDSLRNSGRDMLKQAAAMYSKKSQAKEAASLGGKALEFVESLEGGALAAGGFFSKSGIYSVANKAGIHKDDLILEDGSSFRRAKMEELVSKSMFPRVGTRGLDGVFVPLTAFMGREPAQGPLSYSLHDMRLDPSIPSNRNTAARVYFPEVMGDTKKTSGMLNITRAVKSLDNDQDQIFMFPGQFKTKVAYAAAMEKQQSINKTVQDMHPLLEAMNIKSSSKVATSLSSFSEVEKELISHSEYQAAGMLKGTERKSLAPAADRLASQLTQTSAIDAGNDAAKLTKSRAVIYRMVENLLKTSHQSTQEFYKQGVSPIEQFMELRNSLVSNTGKGVEDYKSKAKVILGKQLNIQNMTEEHQKETNTILDTILTADALHAKKVPIGSGFDTLHLAGDTRDGFEAYLKNGSNLEATQGSWTDDVFKTGSQLYNEADNAMMSTLRNNKKLLGFGAAAIIGTALLTRQSPANIASQNDESMQHSSQMMSPSQKPEPPMGRNTNTTRTGYVTPKSYAAGNSAKVSGSYNKSDDPQDRAYDFMTSVFKDGIRTARLENF